jgi:hypothetical protein
LSYGCIIPGQRYDDRYSAGYKEKDGSTHLLHKLDEVALGRFGQQTHAGAQRVLFGSEPVVWWELLLHAAALVAVEGHRGELSCTQRGQFKVDIYFITK